MEKVNTFQTTGTKNYPDRREGSALLISWQSTWPNCQLVSHGSYSWPCCCCGKCQKNKTENSTLAGGDIRWFLHPLMVRCKQGSPRSEQIGVWCISDAYRTLQAEIAWGFECVAFGFRCAGSIEDIKPFWTLTVNWLYLWLHNCHHFFWFSEMSILLQVWSGRSLLQICNNQDKKLGPWNGGEQESQIW